MAASVYDKRAESETSLMAINIFNSAAAYAKAGRKVEAAKERAEFLRLKNEVAQ